MCIATYQKNKLDLLLQIELLVLRFEISLHQSTVCNGATVEGVVLFRFRFCEDDKKSSLIIPPICLRFFVRTMRTTDMCSQINL